MPSICVQLETISVKYHLCGRKGPIKWNILISELHGKVKKEEQQKNNFHPTAENLIHNFFLCVDVYFVGPNINM